MTVRIPVWVRIADWASIRCARMLADEPRAAIVLSGAVVWTSRPRPAVPSCPCCRSGDYADRYSSSLNRPSFFYHHRTFVDDLLDESQLHPVRASLLGYIFAPDGTRALRPEPTGVGKGIREFNDRLVNAPAKIDMSLHQAMCEAKLGRHGLSWSASSEPKLAVPVFDDLLQTDTYALTFERTGAAKALHGFIVAPARTTTIGDGTIECDGDAFALREAVAFAKIASHGLIWQPVD